MTDERKENWGIFIICVLVSLMIFTIAVVYIKDIKGAEHPNNIVKEWLLGELDDEEEIIKFHINDISNLPTSEPLQAHERYKLYDITIIILIDEQVHKQNWLAFFAYKTTTLSEYVLYVIDLDFVNLTEYEEVL